MAFFFSKFIYNFFLEYAPQDPFGCSITKSFCILCLFIYLPESVALIEFFPYYIYLT